jgi:tetratricopeptide (TPR) repeat protein
MADPKPTPAPTTQLADTPDTPTPETTPSPPEPITPERVSALNRYYDRYVIAGVLLVIAVATAHKIIDSSFWSHLAAGRLVIQRGITQGNDPLSFATASEPWINIPWIYQVVHYGLFENLQKLASADPARGEQIAGIALVVLNILVRLATAAMLFRLLRKGPGRWWATLVLFIAFGLCPFPAPDSLVFTIGGIAQQAKMTPETWGVLFLAWELVLIQKALEYGCLRSLWTIPALMLLWANCDENFIIGLVVLIAAAIGHFINSRSRGRENAIAPPLAFAASAASLIAVMVHPALWNVYPAALAPWIERFSPDRAVTLTVDQLSLFDPESKAIFGAEFTNLRLGFFLILCTIGLFTFWLNRRRFSLSRLLVFLAGCLLWATLLRYNTFFAVIWAATLIQNGQDWYLDRLGAEGRLGAGWNLYAIGGRSLTILAYGLAAFLILTGLGMTSDRFNFIGQPPGLGIQQTQFPFEAADFLKSAEIRGRVLNLSVGQGDAILWRAYPLRQSYIDGRSGIDRRALRREMTTLRDALRKDDIPRWSEILDKYGATCVLTSRGVGVDLPVQQALEQSPNWTPVYDDGMAVLFGRVDKPTEDQAFFDSNKLDADAMVYTRPATLLAPDRTPSRVDLMDRIVRHRTLAPTDPHLDRSRRWLVPPPGAKPEDPLDPARCLLAVREARTAIARNPDDPDAYRALDLALQALSMAESNLLVANPMGQPIDFLGFRFRQRAAALSFAIATLPEPYSPNGRAALGQLHLELAQLYRSNGDLDLERDELAKAQQYIPPADFPEDAALRLSQLAEAVEQFQAQLDELGSSGQVNPVIKANQARSNGFPGIAIKELENAESQGVPLDAIKALLVDLYCRTGQPDKANDLIAQSSTDLVEDTALDTGPGTPSYRNALVSFLLGYHANAISLLRDRAIPQLRQSIAGQAITAARMLFQGQPLQSVQSTLELTGSPAASGQVKTQATWLIHLGLIQLEAGDPEGAAASFTNALELDPANSTRPLLAYYLDRLGKPVPPIPQESDSVAEPLASAAPSSASPSANPAQPPQPDSSPEPAKSEEPVKPNEPAKSRLRSS